MGELLIKLGQSSLGLGNPPFVMLAKKSEERLLPLGDSERMGRSESEMNLYKSAYSASFYS
ncbi:hypothetical protein KY285_017375 [Solanum tuberosum]|nr:hypothetical protein KY285_017375 [Solanum tuberosum]